MRVGYVAQEPHLDLGSTVRESLNASMAPIQSLIDEYNAVFRPESGAHRGSRCSQSNAAR